MIRAPSRTARRTILNPPKWKHLTKSKPKGRQPEKAFLDPTLGERLRVIYQLDDVPQTPVDFLRLLKLRSKKHPGLEKFIQKVKSGSAVIGERKGPTRHMMILERGRQVHVACAYDALMSALLRGRAAIRSTCPHCEQQMEIEIQGGKLLQYSSLSTVFYWGAGPEGSPGHPICDHIHFFPSTAHLTKWMKSSSGELGFSLTVEEAAAFLTKRF